MQRMFNLDKWTRLSAEGESLHFENPRPRNVRLEVNAPVKTAIHVIDEDGEAHFLALVEGRETVEFGSTGAFSLVSDGDVNVYTADGADISSVVVDPVIFTKIAQRRARNPEMEAMAHMMMQNMERRLAATVGEMETRAMERARAETSRAAAVIPPVVAPQAGASEPASSGASAPVPASGDGTGTGEQAGATV